MTHARRRGFVPGASLGYLLSMRSDPASSPPSDAVIGAPVRRRVLYVHGFDPAGAARYRRLILRGGGREAPEIVRFSPVSEGWRSHDPAGAEMVFEMLRYEDIVRGWRARPAPAAFLAGLGRTLGFIFGGGLRRLAARTPGPAALLFYPLAGIGLCLGAGYLLGAGATGALGLDGWAGAAARLAGAALGFQVSLLLERSFFLHLMLALFGFLFRIAKRDEPALEARISLFAARMLDAVDPSVDEVLIVGHSLGGVVAARALAEALARDPELAQRGPALSFLTLGSVGAYVSAARGPGAKAYGAALLRIASTERLFWVDVSSPRDWFSAGLVDPLLLIGEAPEAARSPRVISAKFGPARRDPDDRRTRFRAMGLHMRYLGAPEEEGGFDFSAAISGALTLNARYGPRRDSPKARMLRR